MDDIKLLQHLISLRPESSLARISEAIGPGPTALLMRSLAGSNIYLPSKRTLLLRSLPLLVREHTAGLSGKNKKRALKELSKVYSMPTWKIRKYAKHRLTS